MLSDFCVIATVLSVASTGVIFSGKFICRNLSPFRTNLSTVNRMARHIYDIPLAWIDEYYLKVTRLQSNR